MVICLWLAGWPGLPAAFAESGESDAVAPPAGVLDQPLLAQAAAFVGAALADAAPERARLILDPQLAANPGWAELHVLDATIRLAEGDRKGAVAALARAVEAGFRGLADLLDTPFYAPLADNPAMPDLRARSAALPQPRSPVPAMRQEGRVEVGTEALAWDRGVGRFRVRTSEGDTGTPLIAEDNRRPVAQSLRRYEASAQGAAGLAGVLYDNRDRGHSRLAPEAFPQLGHVAYGADLGERNLDYGLAGPFLFDRITLGNSSTAVTSGQAPRSLPRLAMTMPDGPRRAFQEYAANHIYVYPGHRDWGALDLFPANWPYMLVSDGSSRSDQPFLHALALTLAAFTPDTRARLEREGLVAPTLQMLLRRSLNGVSGAAGYLSGRAHPVVFAAPALREDRMMALARAMRPDEFPPMVVLEVEREDFAGAAGLAGLNERLFDTPSAVARVWRALEYRREMTISAAATRDPNGRDLRFEWAVLQGEPDRVRIEPLDAQASRARIVFDWHDRRQAGPTGRRLTDRVEIGVFADNGRHLSAPAFVTVLFPGHQQRRYIDAGAPLPVLAEVDYDAAARGAGFDPVLFWQAPWRDVFEHDETGRVTGWQRHMDGGEAITFSADGLRDDGARVRHELSGPPAQRRLRVVIEGGGAQ